MKKTIIYLFLFVSIGLAGCSLKVAGTKDLYANSLTINSDGSFVQIIAEDFDKDYYSVDELENMIKEDISFKNISLENIEYRDSERLVSVTLKYKDINAYTGYNDTDFYYGTLSEAFFNGMIKQTVFKDIRSGNAVSISSDFVDKYKDYKIIITKDNMNLYTFGEVFFLDDNADYDKKSRLVTFKETNQKHIIIFK